MLSTCIAVAICIVLAAALIYFVGNMLNSPGWAFLGVVVVSVTTLAFIFGFWPFDYENTKSTTNLPPTRSSRIVMNDNPAPLAPVAAAPATSPAIPPTTMPDVVNQPTTPPAVATTAPAANTSPLVFNKERDLDPDEEVIVVPKRWSVNHEGGVPEVTTGK